GVLQARKQIDMRKNSNLRRSVLPLHNMRGFIARCSPAWTNRDAATGSTQWCTLRTTVGLRSWLREGRTCDGSKDQSGVTVLPAANIRQRLSAFRIGHYLRLALGAGSSAFFSGLRKKFSDDATGLPSFFSKSSRALPATFAPSTEALCVSSRAFVSRSLTISFAAALPSVSNAISSPV